MEFLEHSKAQPQGARWAQCLAPSAAEFPFGVVLEGSSQSSLKEVTEQGQPVRRAELHRHRLLVLYLPSPLEGIASRNQLHGLPRLTVQHSIAPQPGPSGDDQARVSVDDIQTTVQLLRGGGPGLSDADWSTWLQIPLNRLTGPEDCGIQILGYGGIDLPATWHRSPAASVYENRRPFFGLP